MAFERPIQELEGRLAELEQLSGSTQLDITEEMEAVRTKLKKAIDEAYADLSPWDQVRVARHPERPVVSDIVTYLFDEFMELHGDKTFGDDPAILTGFGTLQGRRVMVVGHRKGKTTKERVECNFGCAHPEGYRKALRKMKLAEKLGIPIITLINTPGAYPGIGAEERGQAAAIAENILAMFSLRVPIVTCVIGEGGSGGALGIGIADRVMMMQYSYYSVISPEGCAAILWKDAERTPDAAAALGLTASTLIDLKIVDQVVEEPPGGGHRNPTQAMDNLGRALVDALDDLAVIPTDRLIAERREKFRRVGAIEGRFPVLA
ncbi:MAG: acetyl-CoA carboxylase carboxyltransferase subunit alpha [Planctomycetes bacterium]|nr:acetyl-CoA carboxylase carboxyltransferase subunit alpha [Planctomycetota bacterium]MCB9910694.1 acetyl-CoA carboxylase carboxyltransferase subunit alpha [Planctomycetota bacterium]